MPTWTGAVSTDWNTAGNWVSPSTVPTASTDAIFTGTPTRNCTTGTATRTCLNLNTTGYLGTLEIGSSIAGVLRVVGNITLGSQPGHIIGLSDLTFFAASGSVTLDVQAGVIIPSLSIAPNANFTLNVVLTRTTVVTNYRKEGTAGSSVNFTSGGGSVELQITNMRLTTTGGSTFAVNTALRFMGSATYDTFLFGGGSMILDTGATFTPVITTATTPAAAINNGVTISLGGTANINFSAGTLVYPALSATNKAGTYLSLGAGAMTFNFGSNTVENIIVGALPNVLSVVLQSNLVINRTLSPGFGILFTGSFNVIVKETLSRNIGTIRNNAGGKLIYQGTSTGFIGTGYIAGNTFNVVSVIQGNLSTNSVIHAPSVSTAANFISGVTTFGTTYSVTTSQTIGSLGSPVMFYGYGICNLSIGDAVGSNVVLEIDAGSNNVYFVGSVIIGGNTTEIRYLNTNTGIFDGSKGGIVVTALGGIIDFQNQSSVTKFVGSISNNAFFCSATLKSDIYVTILSLLNGSGMNQIGSRTIYVSGNLSMNNGNGAGSGPVVSPSVVLYGAAPCTFNCSQLNANVTINKVGGTVTNIANFGFSIAAGSPYTFKLDNGTFLLGGFLTTIGASAILDTPGVTWNNITISTNVTLTINALLTISGLLLISGNATFTGTHGWTATSFTHGGVATSCTLKAGITYTVQGGTFTMVGTAGSRLTLQSDDFQNVTVNIPASSDQMTLASGTIPAPVTGYVLGSRAYTNALPAALSNLIPDRPTILSGPIGAVYTLTQPIGTTPVTSALLLQVGKKAFFNVFGTTNVLYAQTRDIDSNGGITIFAGQSFSDNTATPNLFRTLNWGPLVAPSGSVYYTFVS
jgi:hypothetical protein